MRRMHEPCTSCGADVGDTLMLQEAHDSSIRLRSIFAILTLLVALTTIAGAAEPTKTDRKFIEMQTSINAIMVGVVDWSAHEIWESAEADRLTGRNWLTTKQYAVQLLAAGTLVSLGGTGPRDRDWVREQAWQVWAAQLIDESKHALQAIEAQDVARLRAAADQLVFICEGCHAAFKPDIPTEGILHVPHHEYGESLVPE